MRDSKKGFYAFIYCIGSVKCLYACIYWKKWRFGQVLPMPDTQTDRQTTEDRATQLLYSIQFKLSYAICNISTPISIVVPPARAALVPMKKSSTATCNSVGTFGHETELER